MTVSILTGDCRDVLRTLPATAMPRCFHKEEPMLTNEQIMQGDNLRPHRQGDRLAAAAVRFMDSVAKGTVFIPLPDHDGKAMESVSGIFYRSLAGDVYEATLVTKAADRLVIDVKVPGIAEPVRMRNIKFAQGRLPSGGHPPSTGEPPVR